MREEQSVKGVFEKLLPKQTGTGAKGTWQKQEFVITTTTQYPKTICFEAWGEQVDAATHLNEGEEIEVFYNPESREYNGKYYTTLKAWKWNVKGAEKKEFKGEEKEKAKVITEKLGLENDEDLELPF